jgi:hypothetical protein
VGHLIGSLEERSTQNSKNEISTKAYPEEIEVIRTIYANTRVLEPSGVLLGFSLFGKLRKCFNCLKVQAH